MYKRRTEMSRIHILDHRGKHLSGIASTARSNMIFAATLLLSAIAAVNCQVRGYRPDPYYDESPKPYAFNFNAPLEDGIGHISRSETADGTGKVQGSYSLANDEGHTRYVDYIADQYGFRANIRTNEPGTDNQNPADVVIESTAPLATAHRAAQYSPINRRPVLNTIVEPVAPVEALPVIPEPPRRPVYRRPPQIRPYRRN